MNSPDEHVIGLLNINPELPIDEDFPQWILGLLVIQVVMTSVAIAGLLLFSFIYRKRTLFHTNLKVLVANTVLLWVIMMSCRFTIAMAGLINWRIIAVRSTHVLMSPFRYVEMLRVTCGYGTLCSVASLVLERIAATVYIGSYEQSKNHPRFIIFIIMSIWIFGITSTVLSYGKLQPSLFTIAGLILVAIISIGVR
jgi:hypothetical protein